MILTLNGMVFTMEFPFINIHQDLINKLLLKCIAYHLHSD